MPRTRVFAGGLDVCEGVSYGLLSLTWTTTHVTWVTVRAEMKPKIDAKTGYGVPPNGA